MMFLFHRSILIISFGGLCFLSFFSHQTFAQTDIVKKPMGIPQPYILPYKGVEQEVVMNYIRGTRWIAFSDRGQSIPVKSQGATKSGFNLKFLDIVYVVDEREGFIHAFLDNDYNLELNKFSLSAKDLGWLEKSKFPLWKHCLVDSSQTINIQAITLNESGFMSTADPGSLDDGIQVFKDPDLKVKSNSKSHARQIYFVYKETANALLLGTDRRISTDTGVRTSILGWVARSHCHLLVNRYWLSPNFDLQDDEKSDKASFPVIFIDENHARIFQKTSVLNETFVLWKDPDLTYKSPELLRFPIVWEKEGIVKVKVIEDDIVTGYAVLEGQNIGQPGFKLVTLLTNNELNELVYNMRKFIESSAKSPRRENIRNQIYKLLSSEYTGIEEQKVDNLTFKKVFASVFMVCRANNKILMMKIRKLADTEEISDEALDQLISVLKEKESALSNIMNSNQEKYSFVSNEVRYYWIDLDYLL
jgi:hypothetical protein